MIFLCDIVTKTKHVTYLIVLSCFVTNDISYSHPCLSLNNQRKEKIKCLSSISPILKISMVLLLAFEISYLIILNNSNVSNASVLLFS